VTREETEGKYPHTPGVLYGCENTGVAGKGFCKNMKTRTIKIDGSRKTPWVGEEGRNQTGTRQQNLGLKITASVTVCQVRN
jgi:hypothetical protein